MKIKQKMKNWYLSYKDAKTTDVYRKEQSLITHSAERLKHVGNFDLTAAKIRLFSEISKRQI